MRHIIIFFIAFLLTSNINAQEAYPWKKFTNKNISVDIDKIQADAYYYLVSFDEPPGKYKLHSLGFTVVRWLDQQHAIVFLASKKKIAELKSAQRDVAGLSIYTTKNDDWK